MNPAPALASDAPDAAWMARVRARDPEALGRLFDAHFDRLFGLVHRLTGARATAEDVLQEVFLRLHRSADRLDPGRDPGAWLVTIAVNLCRDHWRSGAYRASRRSVPIGDEAVPASNPPAPASAQPDEQVLRLERERLVQDALMRLPEDQRTAVLLRDWYGLDHEQIATATGTSHAAARKRYSRALERLAELLRETLAP